MNGLSLIVFALSIAQLIYVQATLNIVISTVNCPVAKPEYFENVDIHMTNEINTVYVNFTLIKRFPETGMTFLKLMGFADGDYTVPTGLEFSMPQCEAYKEKEMGNRMFKAVGIDPDVCPSLPGVYGNNKLELIDPSTLPETFPANKYVMEFGTRAGDEIIYLCRNYFTVEEV